MPHCRKMHLFEKTVTDKSTASKRLTYQNLYCDNAQQRRNTAVHKIRQIEKKAVDIRDFSTFCSSQNSRKQHLRGQFKAHEVKKRMPVNGHPFFALSVLRLLDNDRLCSCKALVDEIASLGVALCLLIEFLGHRGVGLGE